MRAQQRLEQAFALVHDGKDNAAEVVQLRFLGLALFTVYCRYPLGFRLGHSEAMRTYARINI